MMSSGLATTIDSRRLHVELERPPAGKFARRRALRSSHEDIGFEERFEVDYIERGPARHGVPYRWLIDVELLAKRRDERQHMVRLKIGNDVNILRRSRLPVKRAGQ